jgi:hypothetical protein
LARGERGNFLSWRVLARGKYGFRWGVRGFYSGEEKKGLWRGWCQVKAIAARLILTLSRNILTINAMDSKLRGVSMPTLQSFLMSFDRKERHALLNTIFKNNISIFSQHFLDSLASECGINLPKDYIWFIDYHIDWIEASIFCYLCKTSLDKKVIFARNGNDTYPEFTLNFTQQDVDFLIYYQTQGRENFILVEAKYTMDWNDKQFQEKNTRFAKILKNYKALNIEFGSNTDINFYYIFMSPKRPRQLEKFEDWKWIELPQEQQLYSVSRCTSKVKTRKGDFWSCFKQKTG